MPQDPASTAQNDQPMPTGTDVYDAIMAGIEQDLLTKNIPLLDEKYKDESEQERAARLARYQKAYALYDEQYKEWIADLTQLVAESRRDALKSAEAKERAKEEEVLHNLESQMNS